MIHDTVPSWREFGKVLLTGFAAAIAIALLGWAVREYGVLHPPTADRLSGVAKTSPCTIPMAVSEEWDRIADFLAGE